MLIDFSDYELDMIKVGLINQVDSLSTYIDWVNDKPMLPNIEVAINNIKEEIFNYRNLIIKVYDEQRKG